MAPDTIFLTPSIHRIVFRFKCWVCSFITSLLAYFSRGVIKTVGVPSDGHGRPGSPGHLALHIHMLRQFQHRSVILPYERREYTFCLGGVTIDMERGVLEVRCWFCLCLYIFSLTHTLSLSLSLFLIFSLIVYLLTCIHTCLQSHFYVCSCVHLSDRPPP